MKWVMGISIFAIAMVWAATAMMPAPAAISIDEVSLKFMPPEVADGLVANVCGDGLSILFVSIEPQDIGQARIVLFEERVQRVAQDVLHAHPPGIRPELLERFEET